MTKFIHVLGIAGFVATVSAQESSVRIENLNQDLYGKDLRTLICTDFTSKDETFGLSHAVCMSEAKLTLKKRYTAILDDEEEIVTLLVVDFELKSYTGKVELAYKLPKSVVVTTGKGKGKIISVPGAWGVSSSEYQATEHDELLSIEVSDSTRVKRILKKDETKVAKEVRDNFAKVDLSFELGDGYYDVERKSIFEVLSLDSKSRIGYFILYWVTYSEDDSDEAAPYWVRFDLNGNRVSAIGDYE